MTPTTLIHTQVHFQRKQYAIIENFSFCLASREVCIITGQNGSGKSTLLKLTAGLYWPDQGKISFQNQSSSWSSIHEDYLQHCHYLSHENGLKPALTVKENLELMQILCGESPNSQKTLRIAEELQFPHQLHQAVHALSFGQRRRLAFARLFIKAKPLWILDEPFTGIDAHHRHYLQQKIVEHLQQNGMAIISTHDALHFDHITTHHVNLSS